MDAGLLRNLVTFQQYVEGFDEIGNPSYTWKDYKKDYAYINGLSGREYWEAAVVHGENTVEFTFRWKPYFDSMNTKQYRLIFNGAIYNITSIDNIQFRNKTVKIKAVTKSGTEQ